MFRITTAGLVALTCLAGAAAAQQDTPPQGAEARPHPILRMDADNDGQVTLDEALASPLAGADADGDGVVSREEFVAHAVARATTRANAMFDRMDQAGEGRIALDALPQRERHEARIRRMFERADADGDGVLSAEEIAALPEPGRGGPRGKEGRGARDGRGGPDHRGPDHRGPGFGG